MATESPSLNSSNLYLHSNVSNVAKVAPMPGPSTETEEINLGKNSSNRGNSHLVDSKKNPNVEPLPASLKSANHVANYSANHVVNAYIEPTHMEPIELPRTRKEQARHEAAHPPLPELRNSHSLRVESNNNSEVQTVAAQKLPLAQNANGLSEKEVQVNERRLELKEKLKNAFDPEFKPTKENINSLLRNIDSAQKEGIFEFTGKDGTEVNLVELMDKLTKQFEGNKSILSGFEDKFKRLRDTSVSHFIDTYTAKFNQNPHVLSDPHIQLVFQNFIEKTKNYPNPQITQKIVEMEKAFAKATIKLEVLLLHQQVSLFSSAPLEEQNKLPAEKCIIEFSNLLSKVAFAMENGIYEVPDKDGSIVHLSEMLNSAKQSVLGQKALEKDQDRLLGPYNAIYEHCLESNINTLLSKLDLKNPNTFTNPQMQSKLDLLIKLANEQFGKSKNSQLKNLSSELENFRSDNYEFLKQLNSDLKRAGNPAFRKKTEIRQAMFNNIETGKQSASAEVKRTALNLEKQLKALLMMDLICQTDPKKNLTEEQVKNLEAQNKISMENLVCSCHTLYDAKTLFAMMEKEIEGLSSQDQVNMLTFCKTWVDSGLFTRETSQDVLNSLIRLTKLKGVKNIGPIIEFQASLRAAFGEPPTVPPQPPSLSTPQLPLLNVAGTLQQIKTGNLSKAERSQFISTLANDLSILSKQSIANIKSAEILQGEKAKDTEGFRGASDLANTIKNWISMTMLVTEDPVQRSKLADFFVDLAKEVERNNDLHLSFCLVTAFDSYPISRLKAFKNKENDIDQLRALVDPRNNNKALRDKIKVCENDNVPYVLPMALLSRDLTFVSEGNPKIVNGGYNISRLNLMAKLIKETKKNIDSFSQQGRLTQHTNIHTINKQNWPDEETLTEKSRKLEPPPVQA